ncbi:unnamed protein product [Ambrosiozyma monospora]|uniref:Unnamed protein product n=1 Tax=Ambrosiozyma monospora TaxID=43982 RepID=A0ACB5U208_AMBMO|nr:unnamed protein product [Ambrosiozyma monospora]
MSRFPIVDKPDALEWHLDRKHLFMEKNLTRDELVHKVKLLLLYAIGLRLLLLSGIDNSEVVIPYTFVDFYNIADRCIREVVKTVDLESVACLTLTAVYMLRTSNGEEMWHLLSMAIRYCVELNLHRKEPQPIPKGKLHASVMRRRIFWTCCSLDKGICLHVGRPFSLSEYDIDVDMPYNINTSVKDEDELYNLIYVHPELTDFSNVITDLSTFQCLLKIHRVESLVQNKVYRVDRKLTTEELVIQTSNLYELLDKWQYEIPKFQDEYSQLFMTLFLVDPYVFWQKD